jgi:hypothetical protein
MALHNYYGLLRPCHEHWHSPSWLWPLGTFLPLRGRITLHKALGSLGEYLAATDAEMLAAIGG